MQGRLHDRFGETFTLETGLRGSQQLPINCAGDDFVQHPDR